MPQTYALKIYLILRKSALSRDIKATVIRLLANREHSLKELKDKLMLRDYDPNDIALVLEFVIKYDLQSEIRYIEMVIRSRANKGYGPGYIKDYLKQKGIKDDLINISLSESGYNWDEIITNVLVKKYGGNKISSSDSKAIRFMFGRGFNYQQLAKHLTDEKVK